VWVDDADSWGIIAIHRWISHPNLSCPSGFLLLKIIGIRFRCFELRLWQSLMAINFQRFLPRLL
jgi:hypothetical protein